MLGPLVAFLRHEHISEPGTARVVPDQIEALITLVSPRPPRSCSMVWGTRLGLPTRLSQQRPAAGTAPAQAGELERALEELENAVQISEPCRSPRTWTRAAGQRAIHRRARHKRAAATRHVGTRLLSRWGRDLGRTHTAEIGRVEDVRRFGELTPTERRAPSWWPRPSDQTVAQPCSSRRRRWRTPHQYLRELVCIRARSSRGTSRGAPPSASHIDRLNSQKALTN